VHLHRTEDIIMSKRSFMATVADLRNGRTQDELTVELSKLVEAVETTGKKGTLTLTISVAPAAKNSTLLKIDDEITLKAPKGDRAPTLMFVGEDHTLSLNDPSADTGRTLKGIDSGERAPLKDVSNG
jgi:hypothetical protein